VIRIHCSAFVAVMLLALAGGNVLASSPTPASGATWNSNQHVDYRWKEGDEPPAWMKAAINAAAQDSNDSRDAKAAVLSQSDSGSSWIAYSADIPTNWAIGYTNRSIPSNFTMRLRPQGYPLDWGNLRWCQFYDSPPTGCYDAEMIALHEFGHAQTLDHPDDTDVTTWTDTVMHWAPKTKSKAGWNQHEFGPCDVARLQIRYDPLTNSTPYSTCLDLGTSLSVSASATSAGSGGSVTFTAKLKVADGVSWPLLASNPLSGRSVVIQRRALGGSSWANVGSMTVLDDNGRYTKSLTLSDTYDYRASFAAPNNEGLEGATSPVVRVTVYSSGGECGQTKSITDGHVSMYTC
jgi:hypothetical protein